MKSSSPSELARREARAGFEQLAHEDALRRRVQGSARKRRAGPLGLLLALAALGIGLATGIAAAAEIIG